MHSLIKLLGLLSLVALCAGTTPALSQTSGVVSLTQVAPASLRLRLEHPTVSAGRVQVVRLSSGQTLFTETYSGSAYGCRLDFDHVPSGRYLVWLQAGAQLQRCLVRVQTRNQGSVIRRIRLASDAMPTAVLVNSWPLAPGSRTIAASAALNPITLSQEPR